MESNSFGFEDDFMATMLSDFLDESQGYLSSLNDNLLVLDDLVNALDDNVHDEVDIDVLNEMFRAAHSLKGVSAMLQLDDINRLTHKIENVFDAARGNKLNISRNVVDTMFQAFDRLTQMVDNLKDAIDEPVEYESLVGEMAQLLDATLASQLAPQESAEATQNPKDAASADATASPVDHPVDADPMEGVSNDDDIPNKYLTIFIDETVDSLDSLNDLLLDEENPLVDDLLVICHRIKGSAAAVGLHRAAKLAHLMEDGLQTLRDAGQQISSRFIDGLIVSTDSLRQFVDELKAGELGQDSFASAYRVLSQAVESPAESPSSIPEESREAIDMDEEVTPPATPSVHEGKVFSDDDWSAIEKVKPTGIASFCGKVQFVADLPLVELKAKLIVARLDALGSLLFSNPEESALDSVESLSELVFAVATDSSQDEIESTINLEGVSDRCVFPLTEAAEEPAIVAEEEAPITEEVPPPPSETPAVLAETVAAPEASAGPTAATPSPSADKGGANAGSSRGGRPNETIRVDIDRLDHLMNLAGQLVINKARFVQIGGQLKGFGARTQSSQSLANATSAIEALVDNLNEEAGKSEELSPQFSVLAEQVTHIQNYLCQISEEVAQFHEARSLVNDLADAVHQLDRVSDGIQKSVMDTRMVPIGPLFGRFKRVIRDTTRVNGKDIQLVINGEKTELDKRMIDELGDPLIHMVRNAADHGVESPEERVACGKPRRGVVTLDATHRGNRIEIQVRDDGKGLDPEKLKAKAVAKGLISQEDADRLSTQQAFQLIWEPGFSTAEKVTEVSGRGMGMDIVRAKIEQLNGTVELESELGQGTTVTIRLPLTVAIMPSLLSVIESAVFAVPVESVVEIVQVGESDLATIHGHLTARLRGRVISVVELADLFHWEDGPHTSPTSDDTKTLVIVGSSGEELGIVVDNLVGEEDLVIKTLAENFEDISGLAGASILGDGRVSLILDVAMLLEMAQQKPS